MPGGTLQAAYRHRGFSFVRVLQRCPEFTPLLYADAVKKPDLNEFLVHDDGVTVPELEKVYKGIRANFVKARYMDWPADTWVKASYSFPAPGQVTLRNSPAGPAWRATEWNSTSTLGRCTATRRSRPMWSGPTSGSAW